MSAALRRLADEAPLVYALAAAIGGAIGLGEVWQKVVGAVLALLFGLVVRSVTTSPTTLSNAVTDAATQTATQLAETTVGAAGEITATGSNVVLGTVNSVLNTVGGLAGPLAKGGS